MKRVLFIDRDGTIIKEPADYQIDALHKFDFLEGVITALSRINQGLDYELVMVTNQDGLGTTSYPESDFWPFQELMLRTLASEGIVFDSIHIDRSFPEDASPYRKPGTAMLSKYLKGGYDLEKSFVIGDRWSDIQLAKNLGCKGILIGDSLIDEKPENVHAILRAKSWKEIVNFLFGIPRTGRIKRITSETNIEISLNLDGSGIAKINTGLPFFDHMLDQIARHGQLDLWINADGDLHIDEHHTVEDTAISLGKAVFNALGKKVGIERYGFAIPMDDARAQVLIDFGGRPWLEWDVIFSREKVGDLPTEMVFHFFKSFSDHANCNLNIIAKGDNDHHKIEAIFKAFAKALKMAKNKTANDFSIPSTKGIL